jgi:hypothetical protein
LILVSGGVLIAVAVLLARQGGRLRTELRSSSPDLASARPIADDVQPVDRGRDQVAPR